MTRVPRPVEHPPWPGSSRPTFSAWTQATTWPILRVLPQSPVASTSARDIRGVAMKSEHPSPATSATERSDCPPSEMRAYVTPPQTPDQLSALLLGCSRGNQSDFARFYQATGSHVFALIGRIIDDSQLRPTVMEDTYIEVWRSAASYKVSENRPLTWVLLIARRIALQGRLSSPTEQQTGNLLQTARRSASTPDHRSCPDATSTPSNTPYPFDGLRMFERECLDQAFLQARTYPEIATALRLPRSVVQTSLRDGAARLHDRPVTSLP
jgi:RNA polymerase sigma-70 factor (ECF subfamily)